MLAYKDSSQESLAEKLPSVFETQFITSAREENSCAKRHEARRKGCEGIGVESFSCCVNEKSFRVCTEEAENGSNRKKHNDLRLFMRTTDIPCLLRQFLLLCQMRHEGGGKHTNGWQTLVNTPKFGTHYRTSGSASMMRGQSNMTNRLPIVVSFIAIEDN
jgi:hypothetical protein